MNSEIMREQLRRRVAESYLNTALQGIAGLGDEDAPYAIIALIDKIVFSGDWNTHPNDWNIIKEVFPHLHFDKNYVPENRMPNYRVKLIRNFTDCQVIIFTDVIDYHLPPFRMEIHTSEGTTLQEFKMRLHQLSRHLPHLKISHVEYTIDLYCHDYMAVQRLFRALRKYAFFPYQRKAISHGRDEHTWGDKFRMNMTYRVGDVKFYERGPDYKRKERYWNLVDTDRVRLEFTARRSTLVKYGIDVLSDFVERPQFHAINEKFYTFKCFEGSKILPHYGNAYTARDEKGNGGCFQLELIHRRHEVKNVHQYMRDVHQLDDLKSELRRSMIEFDSQWIQLT